MKTSNGWRENWCVSESSITQGVMDQAVTEADRGILLISQFTLLASFSRKGNRPSWHRAALPRSGRTDLPSIPSAP